MSKLVDEVRTQNPSLWGERQPRQFLKHQVYWVIYKLVEGIGFGEVKKRIRFDYPMSQSSLEHNFATIVTILEQWSKSQIQVGTVEEWKRAFHGRSDDSENSIEANFGLIL